ncbi:two pore channel protein 1-like [Scylla paramamosain]|uniref:two pore channel protein 1-like n=1 Tax=Scylla paramamosain TaxID=85552 RepID=UPI003082E106
MLLQKRRNIWCSPEGETGRGGRPVLTNMEEGPQGSGGGREGSFSSLYLSMEDNHSSRAASTSTTASTSTYATDDPTDIPYKHANTSIASEAASSSPQSLNEGSSSPSFMSSSWEMNYHEAAIFLEEGENNDKFNSHPRDRSALPAYLVTHNHWFYSLDLFAALLLLSLAIIEQPAVFHGVPVGVHASIELFGLFLVGISIVMHLRWLGPRTYLTHRRSAVKLVTWIVMLVDAVVVISRNKTHFRVTRALRPIFMVDNRYLGGVRRFLRQILQSVPPIMEIMVILFFILLIFATLGFYLFSPNQKDPYFSTFGQGFVSLYVLLTTANYPDVMMPAYAQSKWSAAFFIAFLSVSLYFIMNLMLAVVFVVFSDIEKEKFRKLLVHKRRACQYAFRLLVTSSCPTLISFKHFRGLLSFFRPGTGDKDALLIFKALNRSETGMLSLNEFYSIYDMCGYKWRTKEPPLPWFNSLPGPIRGCCYLIRRLVTWKWFDYFIYCVIILNAVVLITHTIMLSAANISISHDLHITWDQITVVSIYAVEALLKIIGLGPWKYFHSGWNVWDFIITVLAIVGIVAEEFSDSFFYIVILRPLRLLRLFRVRKRYHAVFQTLVILLPRISSAIIIIIITYYFFAVVGMEVFSQYDMKNCCVNTTVEQFYKDDNTTLYPDYYYLNNFDNIFMAGVTLFELTVVNNWFIIMEGYVAVTSDWSRLYFMTFYLVMMVVMSVVVAFILEAFTFRMEYNHTVMEDADRDDNTIRVRVTLKKNDLEVIHSTIFDPRALQQLTSIFENKESVAFEGVGQRTKIVLQRRMYRDEIPVWISQADRDYEDSPDLPGSSQSPIMNGNEPIPTSTPASHNSRRDTPPSYVGSLNPNGSLEGSSSILNT